MRSREAKQQIQQGEGQQIEFKTSFSEAREAIESLCAFAHADGGTVFFGVRDDGAIVGVHLGKKTLEDFANRARSNTQPPLSPLIYEFAIDGRAVVAAVVKKVAADRVHFAYNRAYIRVGKTNQPMWPDQITARLHSGFRPDARSGATISQGGGNESWSEREERRIELYRRSRGLFLAHTWRPSTQPEQVADIVIYLRQHGDPEHEDCPLSQALVSSVEYHLGPRFSNRTIVKKNRRRNFRLEVSAYGPMLCLARVHFIDGHAPVDLERYIDF
jgi:hypothetical protein